MNSVRRIAKNTTLLFVSQIISYMLGFFVTVYIARYLGTEGYGTISLAIALGAMLVVFTELGLSTLMVREISRDTKLASSYISTVLLIKIVLAILTFLIVVVFVHLAHYSYEVSLVVYIITASFVVNVFTNIFTSVFQANEKMEYQSIGSILNIVITLSGVLLAISLHLSIIYIAVVYLAANIILLMFHFTICAWKFILPKKIVFDRGLTKFLIAEALPLTISGAFLLIAFRIDTIILSLLTNNSEVGIYNAAYNLLVALLFLPSVYVMAIFPVLSRLYVDSKKTLQFSYERSFKYMAILGLPIAVGTTLLSNPIILLIYKSTFYQSIIALQILIWTIPLLFVDNILGVCITSINRQRETVKITFLAMVVNIVLNSLLIPTHGLLAFIPIHGFIAASYITVLTELICFIFWFRILVKHGYKVSIPRMFYKPAIASIIMGLFIVLVKLNLFLEILLGTILYFGVLILLKTFTEDDINLINQLIDIDVFRKILKRNK